MTFEELEHAIRAACDVAHDHEVIVFGSQSILGQFPDAHEDLRQSAEADIMPRNRIDRTDDIDGAIGEGSAFHKEFGFYVHGVSIEAAILPSGWEQRTIPVKTDATRGNTGYCLEGHDLAASKLAAYRDKDRAFVRVLLREGYVKPRKLIERLR
ncbi:MAG: DUF6036 family nucleotidyltransferase, partial [Gemmatimonadaceae bacterium]